MSSQKKMPSQLLYRGLYKMRCHGGLGHCETEWFFGAGETVTKTDIILGAAVPSPFPQLPLLSHNPFSIQQSGFYFN